MTTNPSCHHDDEVMHTSTSPKASLLVTNLRGGLWKVGSFAWMFAVVDRSVAFFANGASSAISFAQVFLVAFLFIAWLYLKPEKLATRNVSTRMRHRKRRISVEPPRSF
jgi:membrane protein YdbS with pleckstrin-like domain